MSIIVFVLKRKRFLRLAEPYCDGVDKAKLRSEPQFGRVHTGGPEPIELGLAALAEWLDAKRM